MLCAKFGLKQLAKLQLHETAWLKRKYTIFKIVQTTVSLKVGLKLVLHSHKICTVQVRIISFIQDERSCLTYTGVITRWYIT